MEHLDVDEKGLLGTNLDEKAVLEYFQTNEKAALAYILDLKEQNERLREENIFLKRKNFYLEEKLKLLKNILDKVPAYIFLKDGTGKYIFVNEFFCKMLGLSEKDIVGNDAFGIFGKDLAEEFEVCDSQVCLSKDVQTCKVSYDLGGVKTDLLLIKVPILNQDGEIESILGIGVDNTQTENTLRLTERINRIFMHEIKAPLSGLFNLMQLLKENPADLNEFLDNGIVDLSILSLKRCFQIIDEQNVFVNLESGHYKLNQEVIKIKEIFHEILIYLKQTIEKKELKIQYFYNNKEIGDEDQLDLDLYSDKGLLLHLYSNILKNAIEAAPNGTIIKINLLNDGYSVYITNHGMIPEPMQDRFFEKFTTFGKKDGTGIGTYLSSLIVKALLGKISFQTNEKDGTTIYVDIPKPEEDISNRNYNFSKQSVLLLDEEGSFYNSLSQFSKNIDLVNNSKDLLTIIEGNGIDKFDIIMLDMYLMDIDSESLVKSIKNKGFKGIIIFHGRNNFQDIPDYMKSLGDGYINGTDRNLDILNSINNIINIILIKKVIHNPVDFDKNELDKLVILNDSELINYLIKIVIKGHIDYTNSLIVLHRIHEYLEAKGEEVKVFIVKIYIYILIFRTGIGSLACKYQENYIKDFYEYYNLKKQKGEITFNAQIKLEKIFGYMFYWLGKQKEGDEIMMAISKEDFMTQEDKIRIWLNQNLYKQLFFINESSFNYIKSIFEYIKNSDNKEIEAENLRKSIEVLEKNIGNQIMNLKSYLLLIKKFLKENKIDEKNLVGDISDLNILDFITEDFNFKNKNLRLKLINSSKFLIENYKNIELNLKENPSGTIILDVYLLNLFLFIFLNKLLKKKKEFYGFLNIVGECEFDQEFDLNKLIDFLKQIDISKIELNTLERNYIKNLYDSIVGDSKSLGNSGIGINYFYDLGKDVINSPDLTKFDISKIVSDYIIANMHISPAGTISYFLSQKLYDEYIKIMPLEIIILIYLNIVEKVDVFYSPGHNKRVDVISQYILKSLLDNPEFINHNGDEIVKIQEFLDMFKGHCGFEKSFTLSKIHDIGKVGARRDLLGKLGKLKIGEYENLKSHVLVGIEMFNEILKELSTNYFDDLDFADKIKKHSMNVFLHHERYDGSGYPNGLLDGEIPLISRVLAIADSLEAMLGKRVYDKRNITVSDAVKDIKDKSGTWYDPGLLSLIIDDNFIEFLNGIYKGNINS